SGTVSPISVSTPLTTPPSSPGEGKRRWYNLRSTDMTLLQNEKHICSNLHDKLTEHLPKLHGEAFLIQILRWGLTEETSTPKINIMCRRRRIHKIERCIRKRKLLRH